MVKIILESINMSNPEVVIVGVFDMQVCVPADWTDEQVVEFAEAHNPSGTENGWHIRKQNDKLLAGYDERVKCSDDFQKVHIMLDV